MKFLLSLLVFVLPLSSWGVKWIERGNGGFVLRCPGKVTETFDIYEAQARYGFTLDRSHSSSVEERVQYLISKLETFNQSRASVYNQWAWDFNKESRRIDNVEMFPVPDLGFGARPKDCQLELAIFQREPDVLNRFRYAINQDLWSELDILNQAALIVHEIIYRELISVQDFAGTSEAARYLNGILNSVEFANLKHTDYLTLLQSLGFRNADYGGYSILLKLDDPKLDFKLKFHEPGGLVGAYLDNSSRLYPQDLKIHNIQCYRADSFVNFYPDGKTQSLYLTYSERAGCIPFYEYLHGDTRFSIQANIWKFFPDGKIMAVLKGNIKAIVVKGVPFVSSANSLQTIEASVEFDREGELSGLDLSRHNSCYDRSRKKVFVAPTNGAIEYVFKFDIRHFSTQLQALTPCR